MRTPLSRVARLPNLAGLRYVPTPASAEMKKAPATLGRMTDAFVRLLYVVGVIRASLPVLTHDLHIYHRPLDSSRSLDGEAVGYTS